mmetsp:Transcript_95084/g.268551  ORF Transcript_95084/g.268551 Transcript_95084/m.268551 type:complete len:386 (-) Transcript_95084:9-1166(-)
MWSTRKRRSCRNESSCKSRCAAATSLFGTDCSRILAVSRSVRSFSRMRAAPPSLLRGNCCKSSTGHAESSLRRPALRTWCSYTPFIRHSPAPSCSTGGAVMTSSSMWGFGFAASWAASASWICCLPSTVDKDLMRDLTPLFPLFAAGDVALAAPLVTGGTAREDRPWLPFQLGRSSTTFSPIAFAWRRTSLTASISAILPCALATSSCSASCSKQTLVAARWASKRCLMAASSRGAASGSAPKKPNHPLARSGSAMDDSTACTSANSRRSASATRWTCCASTCLIVCARDVFNADICVANETWASPTSLQAMNNSATARSSSSRSFEREKSASASCSASPASRRVSATASVLAMNRPAVAAVEATTEPAALILSISWRCCWRAAS